jgi:hypothetical protein
MDPDGLRAHPDTARLRRAVLAMMQDLSVIKVKIYHEENMTMLQEEPQSLVGAVDL